MAPDRRRALTLALDALLWGVWALSVAVNMAIGGRVLETLCARAWRCGWIWAVVALDAASEAVGYEADHCAESARRWRAWAARWRKAL